MVENLNVVAEQSLRDRFGRELANALIRLAAKEAVEAGLRSIKTKKKSEDEDGDEEEKKSEEEEGNEEEEEEEYSETLGIILGATANIVNTVTERADIRSWQALPAEIFYRRVPLKRGDNAITVSFFNHYNQRMETHQFHIRGNGGLQVRNLITPDARVISTTTTKQQIKP